jgi:hypothetical protein
MILNHLDWSLVPENTFDILGKFLELCNSKHTHETLIVPYSLSLIAVKVLLNVAITQYELLEQAFESLSEQELLHKFSPSQINSKLQLRDK